MLASKYKLNSVEFRRVFETGSHVHTDHLFVKYLKNQDSFKTAVVVNKKHAKTAIVRNYKRRQIFNSAKQFVASFETEGIWSIIMFKKTSIDVTYQDIEQDVKKVFAKIAK